MKFWTKRTAALMVGLYVMLFLQAIANPSLTLGEVLTVFAASSTLVTVVAYIVKWLYVTAKTTPDDDKPEPEVEPAN